jgi:hypothetical protein
MPSRPTSRPLAPADLRKVLALVMEVPRIWSIPIFILGVVSCFGFTHPADGGLEVSFGVGTSSIVIFALIWLPVLLHLLVLTGGRIKAGEVEVSSGGLIGSTEDLIAGLTNVRTAAEEAELQTPGVEQTLKAVTEKIDQIAAEFVISADAIPDDAVVRLARRYEELRKTLEPGDKRTIEMTRVVNEARVRASADRERACNLGQLLIRSRGQGQRLVGLAFLQESSVGDAFDDVLGLIRSSATAFEMFHALLALKGLVSGLSRVERDSAIETLKAEMQDPRGVGVLEDQNLPSLIEAVISALEQD